MGSLRAVLAFAFLFMSCLQPGMFAGANATGFHGEASAASDDPESIQETNGHEAHHAASSEDGKQHPHGSDGFDKSCEVHCAPCQAVPVGCPDIERVVARCFAPVEAAVFPYGEYATLIRPPEHLA